LGWPGTACGYVAETNDLINGLLLKFCQYLVKRDNVPMNVRNESNPHTHWSHRNVKSPVAMVSKLTTTR
jgi:hypothetical protein